MTADAGPFRTRPAERPAERTWVEAPGGRQKFLLMTSHRGVKTVAAGWRSFSSDGPGRVPIPEESARRSIRQLPIEIDPPRHRRYRQAVVHWFRPARMTRLEPGLSRIADELVGDVAARGGCEVVADVALPMVLRSLALALGCPPSAAERWGRWGHDVYDHVEGRPGAARDFDDEVAGLVHEALAEPGDDLFGHLARAELDGRALQRQELLSFANLLLAAGRGTLVDAIAGSLWHLATHPNDRRRLARHPEFVPRAVEEFLRYVSPLPHIGRIVRRPATVEGARIDAGEQLSLGFAFANRDPAVFAEADACRLGRDPNPHVAFGHGPHLCLGAPLARAELRVVLTAWLAAIPEFGLAGDARLRVVELGSRSLASGFDALPLRVGAGG